MFTKTLLVVAVIFGVTQADVGGYNYDKPTVAFVLPSRQQLPNNFYGVPQRFSSPQTQFPQLDNSYIPPENPQITPDNAYGPPPTELTPPEPQPRDLDVLTTTEIPTTTESEAKEDEPKQSEQIKDAEEVDEEAKDQGVYYIYHPSGLLQRIMYSTRNDVRNMAYTAQFRYKDVEPIRDPIYTYDPETLTLRQIAV